MRKRISRHSGRSHRGRIAAARLVARLGHRTQTWTLLAGLLIMSDASAGSATAATVMAHASSGGEGGVPAVPELAILPFQNFTGHHAAFELMVPNLYAELRASGVSLLTHSDLRPLLRRHRLRSIGSVSQAGAELLRTETGADWLLIGALDLYESRRPMEVSATARLMDLRSMRLRAAWTVAVTGVDHRGWFGRGEEDSLQTLAHEVVEKLASRVVATLKAGLPDEGAENSCSRVALIPFDDLSKTAFGGEIVTSMTIGALLDRGFEVIEPGFVSEILREAGVNPRGEIDLPSLGRLHEALDACLLVTGEIERLQPGIGDPNVATPEVVLGARVIDAVRGRLLAAWEITRSGDDGETIFHGGRCPSLGRLSRSAVDEVARGIEQLEARGR